jgi:hypothetical protein
VGLLLLAFVLNLLKIVSERHQVYLLLNMVGSGLALWYAWVGGTIPFVVLEGAWGLAALVKLAMVIKKAPAGAGA